MRLSVCETLVALHGIKWLEREACHVKSSTSITVLYVMLALKRAIRCSPSPDLSDAD